MRLMTMWGERRDFKTPELMVAWDYYTWDNWAEGFDEECEKARKSWGDDLVQWRIIELDVSEEAIRKAFEAAVIPVTPALAGQEPQRGNP